MGKKSRAPAPPDYTQAAQATAEGNLANARGAVGANRWNEVGPDGTVSWQLRPGADPTNPQAGDFIRTTTLSPEQQALREQSSQLSGQFGDWAGEALGAFQPDDAARQQLTDSLYRRNTQFYDRRFGVDQNSLEAKLANSGLARGSEAWNNEMARFNENKNTAYADASDRAVLGAEQQTQSNQQNNFNRIISALSAMRGGMVGAPQSSNTGAMATVQGPDLLGASQAQFDAALAQTNADNARRAAPWNAAIGLGSSFLLGRR